jgi:predicted nucleic acid-binding protein
MARSREAYVDTSALIAALDRSDSYHQLFVRLFADAPALVTSALVIAEGHGWFLRRYNSVRAIQFLNFVSALEVLTIKAVGVAEIRNIAILVKKFADQALTMPDAHGLVIMAEQRIQICWSTDRHLSLTGVPLVV